MSSPEDRLRDALRADEPAALDPERIIRAARHRRAATRVRFGAAAAVVVVAGVIGVPLAMEVGGNGGAVTATAPEAGTRAPVAPAPADQASEGPPTAAARPGPGAEFVPERTVTVDDGRWCIVDLGNRTAPHCAGDGQHSLRTTDADGTEWLVVVAPSGPSTDLLQIEQLRGWVDLRTSRVPESAEYWMGAVLSDRAPETGRVRALDRDGVEVWAAE